MREWKLTNSLAQRRFVPSHPPVISRWMESEIPSAKLSALQQILSRFLEQNERIVWSGQPDVDSLVEMESGKSKIWLGILTAGIAFVVFVAGSIISQWHAYAAEPTNVMNYWMPAVIGIVACGIAVANLMAPAQLRKRAPYILYAITNERAIIFSPAAVPSPSKGTMHWNFMAVDRTALRDVRISAVPGKEEMQDILWTYSMQSETAVQQKRGEVVAEPTAVAGFYGVHSSDEVGDLFKKLRSASLY